MANSQQEDHWSAEKYQNAAAFVPKLASQVASWLDVQPNDRILDIGCGDGVLTLELAKQLTTGSIYGIDSSEYMIRAAKKDAEAAGLDNRLMYAVHDANKLPELAVLAESKQYDKAFSNAALHWILRSSPDPAAFFTSVSAHIKLGGTFVFEMGGHGNVAEMRTALLYCISKRLGIEAARAADPWFFPDDVWMKDVLHKTGFEVEKCEIAYRQTKMEEGENGGIEGWTRLMGKQFFDQLEEGEREGAVREVVDVLETVCQGASGGEWIGYRRLRVVARKVVG